jgi:hypothetical protein
MAPALRAELLHGRRDYQPDWKGAAAWLEGHAAGRAVWLPDPHSRGCLAYYLEPESDLVFMAARSLDPANRPGDRLRVMDAAALDAAVAGRLDGELVLPGRPLSFTPGPSREAVYRGLYGRPSAVIPGQRPEGDIHILAAEGGRP